MQISNFDSDFLNVISGFPQGSIAASILFNGFANIFFFYFIEIANAQNFADDDTLNVATMTRRFLIQRSFNP